MTTSKTELLEDTYGYWDARHRHDNEWQAGGDKGFSVHRNKAFYAHRLGLLTSILDRYFVREKLRLLDAGCGKGWLTDQLHHQGHTVVGVDFSAAAIKICKENRAGTFHLCALDLFTSRRPFDAVISVDVLFHVLDDQVWESIVRNLVSLTKVDGVFVFAENLTDQTYALGNYILHRSLQTYQSKLHEYGIEIIDRYDYQFGGNPNSFYVAKRKY